MSKVFFFVSLGFWLVAGSAFPAPDRTSRPARLQVLAGRDQVIVGGPAGGAKTVVDTINLMAGHLDPTNGPGEPFYLGDFEDLSLFPAWNGWTSADLTLPGGESHWHVSDYHRIRGGLSAWCGSLDFPSCEVGDPVGGYGNDWNERLEWTGTVADGSLECQVRITAILNHDIEAGYDQLALGYVNGEGVFSTLWMTDGTAEAVPLDVQATLTPVDYGGPGHDEVVLQFRFISDEIFADEDCGFFGEGACQLDDVLVTLSNGGVATFDDFEDGTLGNWIPRLSTGVGDFAQIWTNLEDIDPCRSNYSPQVAFIDDGLVVPGTGGSTCFNWCYGPGGYIVNPEGGLSDPRQDLHNAVDSPVMNWPGTDEVGALFEFDVYHHLGIDYIHPRIFYSWSIRSADVDGSGGHGFQTIADQPWVDRGFVYAEDATYTRFSTEVTDLLVPGVDEVQVRLAVRQMSWAFGMGGDGTPTPYFDNVTLKVFEQGGPAMTAKIPDLAQDAFPASGTLDFEDRGALSVRFDMARNISPAGHLKNDAGDSIVVRIAPVGSGAVLDPGPRLQYVRQGNEAYDPWRTAGLPANGFVDGVEVHDGQGQPTGEWSFDLPDSGFLFPGDVVHYLIVATETGPGGTIQAFLPADTTGFQDFSGPLGYDPNFTMRALPRLEEWYNKSVISSGGPALFWFDAEDLSGLELWIEALQEFSPIGQSQFTTFDFDVFLTRSPASGLGNGLGGRATPAQLDHYGTVLYSSGTESLLTLGRGDVDIDPSNDIGLLDDWLQSPGKNLLLTGDGLAYDLDRSSAGGQFLTGRLGVDVTTNDLRSFIGNQAAPLVRPTPGSGMLFQTTGWVAYGGCPNINSFDGVTPGGGGVLAAEFTDPTGTTGAYPYAAATLNTTGDAVVVSLPYDLMFVKTSPTDPPPNALTARKSLLADILHAFDYMWGPVGDVPGGAVAFAVDIHPNPFNPRVTIAYTVPGPNRLSVKIFDVRGALVRTLLDEQVATSGEAVWDGRTDGGRAVASGVYFYEVRCGSNVEIGKMALVK